MKQVDIKKVHRIHEKDAPCWYGLSFDPKGVALILLVHKKFIEEVGDLNPVPEYIQRFKDGFGFTEFSVDFMSTFGFDKAFEFTKDDGEFIHLKAKLPKVRFHSDNPCERCSGSGKSELQIDRSCPHCGGVGFAYEVNSKSAYAISASLTFFHMVFGISDIDTGCNMPQLMNMQSVILKEPSGASLG